MVISRNFRILALCAAAVLIFAAGSRLGERHSIALADRNLQLQTELAALRADVRLAQDRQRDAEARLKALEAQGAQFPALESYMTDALSAAGIASPEALLANLRSHPEVIPMTPVLGGTMHFTRVGIMDDRWVYGAYEDGHVTGAAIFQWSKVDGAIRWTVLASREE